MGEVEPGVQRWANAESRSLQTVMLASLPSVCKDGDVGPKVNG